MWYKLAQQLQLPGLDVEKSSPIKKERPEVKPEELFETQKEPKSLFFSDWARGYKVPEQPLYHGTTKDFDRFDLDKSQPTNYFGPAFYFTNEKSDAEKNYTGKGKDQQRNFENIQYELIDEFENDDYAFNKYRDDPKYSKYFLSDGTPFNIELLAEEIAKDMAFGGNPRVLPVYMRMKNPMHLTSENDTEHPEKTFVNDTDDSLEFLNNKDFDYNDNNSLKTAIVKIYDILSDYYDEENIFGVLEHLVYKGPESASEFMMMLVPFIEGLDNDQNTEYKGEIIQRFVNALGYDSIVMDPQVFFPDFYKNQKAKHFITWNPENIKHATDNIEFDPKNPVITANSGKINLWKNSLQKFL